MWFFLKSSWNTATPTLSDIKETCFRVGDRLDIKSRSFESKQVMLPDKIAFWRLFQTTCPFFGLGKHIQTTLRLWPIQKWLQWRSGTQRTPRSQLCWGGYFSWRKYQGQLYCSGLGSLENGHFFAKLSLNNTVHIGFCDYGLSGQSDFSDRKPLDGPLSVYK